MRVLVAHPSESFLAMVRRCLEPEYEVRCCWDGTTAMAELDSFRPDALLLHLYLQGKDGMSLLEQTAYKPPVILVLSEWTNTDRSAALQNLGVTDILHMPTMGVLRSTLARQLREQPSFLPVLTVPETLRSLGFNTAATGYRQLCLAGELLQQDASRSFSGSLYPAIARTLGQTDGRAVEKTIRDAIRRAWMTGDRALWRRYFPAGNCPGNRAFLFGILEPNCDRLTQDHAVLGNGTVHG